ncbi:MAG: tetratricopeptide repeat protein [Chloroflexia bacterium]
MTDFSYLNFDVQIQRVGDTNYRVVVEAPSGETIRAPFKLPFSELELENFLLKAGPTRRGVRRADTVEADAAKRFGEKLYDALFTADVRSALQSSLDQARQRGESSRGRVGVRLRLRLADVPELAGVPWEYIYNPALNRFLALSTETPLVRYLDLPERIRPWKVVQPLRVLVMVAGPSDYARLDVRQEWLNLNTAVADLQQAGLVQLDLLEAPTLTGLQRQLRQGDYHIFHFIGHGAFNRNASDGLLILQDDDGRGRAVSGQDLAMLLHDHTPLRLAVLNACEGALSATDDPFAGVAQSLVQGGLPAVIAMQFEITDQAAIVFAHEFYRSLADGYPVDAALTEARKMVLTESRGSGLEWGTPVLYMRAPDGRIFNLQKRQQPTAVAQARADLASVPASEPAAATISVSASPSEEAEAATRATPGGAQIEALAGQKVSQEPIDIPTEMQPVEDAPPANRLHGEQTDIMVGTVQESRAATDKADESSLTRGAGTRTSSRPNTRLIAATLILAAVALIAAAGLFVALGGGRSASLSPEQIPPDAAAHNSLGISAQDAGDLDKAIAEFSEAIRLKPDYATSYLYRALVYRSMNRLDEAIADLNRAAELEPEKGQVYLERGNTYMYGNNYDSALPDFTRAIQLLPTEPDPYYLRGLIYLDTQQYDEAIDDFNKVVDLQPSWQDAYHKRGNAYARKTDYATAIENYTEAIELTPDNADYIYYDRAEAYRLLGDNAAAIADYETVIEKTDSDSLRTDATQRLKALKPK